MIGHEAQHDGTPAGLAARVQALLDRQHELLVRLDDLSKRQMTLLEADRSDRLLDLIAERQHVIDRLQEATDLLDPLRAQWGAAGEAAPQEIREAVRRRMDGIALLIDQINARDEEARRQLGTRRDEIAAELMSIGRGRGALAAYAGAAGAQRPSFQDREA